MSTSKWDRRRPAYGKSHGVMVCGVWGRYGQGRKVKFFSPVLLACYDRESEELQSVCRCMSGFSDEFYEAMTSFYKTEGNSYTGKPKTYIRTGTCIRM